MGPVLFHLVHESREAAGEALATRAEDSEKDGLAGAEVKDTGPGKEAKS